LSFIDRFLLALLVAPLKADLGLDDLQLGLLFGTSFAVFYGLSGLPLARIADTYSRRNLIVGGVLFWSACTTASAFATNFATLAALRFGLAIGEAALVPAALSLLTDLFPARRRILAGTLFSTAGMAGSATAYIVGAMAIGAITRTIAAGGSPGWHVWQLAFIFIGAPGLLFAGLVALIVREPVRIGVGESERPSLGAIWRHVADHGTLYVGLFVGAGFTQLISYSIVAWAPTFLQRAHGLSVEQAGYAFGTVQLIAVVGGTLVVPSTIRYFMATGRSSFAAWLPTILSAIGAAFVAIAPFSGSSWSFLGLLMIGSFLLVGTGNSMLLFLQPIAPPRMRATLTAALLICISCFGLGIGPPLTAVFTQMAHGVPAPLGWGIAGVALVGLAGAVGCFWVSVGRLRTALAQVGA
jgi:MFS family permease